MEILFKGLIGGVFLMIIAFVRGALKAESSLDKEDLNYIREVSKKHQLLKLDLEESAFEEALTEVSEDEKVKYLSDKFMSLKNKIDKVWKREITDIVISPPFLLKGNWTVNKYIKSLNPLDFTGESIEIYRQTDEELVLEMNDAKNNNTDKIKETVNWTCNKCNEENEGSFDSCWKCQTLKQ